MKIIFINTQPYQGITHRIYILLAWIIILIYIVHQNTRLINTINKFIVTVLPLIYIRNRVTIHRINTYNNNQHIKTISFSIITRKVINILLKSHMKVLVIITIMQVQINNGIRLNHINLQGFKILKTKKIDFSLFLLNYKEYL